MAAKHIQQQKCNKTKAIIVTKRQTIHLFILICLYRLANAWMIRTQFDPDEYWQTLEPAYCLVFGGSSSSSFTKNTNGNATNNLGDNNQDIQQHGCALTWEWTRRYTPPSPPETNDGAILQKSAGSTKTIQQAVQTLMDQALHGPVRSYISIVPTYWYYLGCRHLFEWATTTSTTTTMHDSIVGGNDDGLQYYIQLLSRQAKQFIRQHATYMISKGPIYLHAILVVAPTDLSVWLIASRLSNLQNMTNSTTAWPFWALICSLTSWFHGYALIRTYANSVETVCLLVGIALLGPVSF